MNEIKRLEELIEQKEAEYDSANLLQYALKIFLNSGYGAMSNEYFRYFDIRMASAITCSGQVSVRGPAKRVEEKVDIIENTYSDTDSVGGDTVIRTNNGNFTIENLWKKSININEHKPGKFVAELPDYKTYCIDTENKTLKFKKINKIFKHKVRKKMFEITVDGIKTTVTEDHSVMVLRNDAIIGIKICEMKKTDQLIKIKE